MRSIYHRQLTSLAAATSPFSGLSRTTVFAISTAGTGYAQGELISLALASGTAVVTSKWRVTDVANGVPTALQQVNAGWYSTKPTAVTGATYATTSDKSGSGLILTLTWLDNCPPVGLRQLRIQAESQIVRWRDDGVDPSATVGEQIAANAAYGYVEQSFASLKLIEATASAKANVTFYVQ